MNVRPLKISYEDLINNFIICTRINIKMNIFKLIYLLNHKRDSVAIFSPRSFSINNICFKHLCSIVFSSYFSLSFYTTNEYLCINKHHINKKSNKKNVRFSYFLLTSIFLWRSFLTGSKPNPNLSVRIDTDFQHKY